MKKKKTKRSEAEYPGIDKHLNLKIRQDSYDQDYIDQLTDKEKAWLSKFNEEYVSASFKKGKKHLHRTNKLKKSVYDANNARNRCDYSLAKAKKKLADSKEINSGIEANRNSTINDTENTIIELLDLKDRISKRRF